MNIEAVRRFVRLCFEKQPSRDEFEILLAMSMVVPRSVRIGLTSRIINHDQTMRSITIPVLATQGTKDAIISPALNEHLLSCIPRAQTSIFAGAGHIPPFEAPNRFNDELATFTRKYAG